MTKYRVMVYPSGMLPEIIEANSKGEAIEQIWNNIMDNVDFYLDIIAVEIEEEE